MTRVAAIVLAAGCGRRFGGLKQLARVNDVPLVARATGVAEAVAALDPVVVVVGAEARLVSGAIVPGRHRLANCCDWIQGVGASLRCGLASAGPVDAALVLLADQPLIDTELIDAVLVEGLAQVTGAAPAFVAARAVDEAGRPGHPVLLGPALIARAGELRGDVGMAGLLRGAPVLEVATVGVRASLDVDTPADLARANAHA